MAAQTKCEYVVASKMADIKNCEIMKPLNVCRKTVFNLWIKFSREAIDFNKSSSYQVNYLRVKRKPQICLRKMAKELNISSMLLKSIVKEDLR